MSSRGLKQLLVCRHQKAEYNGICELVYVMGVVRFFGFEVDGLILSFLRCALSVTTARYLRIQDHVQRGTFKVWKDPGQPE